MARISRISAEDHDLALAVLEHDQLAAAKSKEYARRTLNGGKTAILWALRLYVLFMMAVVVYQIVAGNR